MTKEMKTDWIDAPVRPEAYDDVEALVRRARKARDRRVSFDWVLSRPELLRLREAVHHWGGPVKGRYRLFDSQVLAAINRAIGEPDSAYALAAPGQSGAVASRVNCSREESKFRLAGRCRFDVLFGYGHAGGRLDSQDVLRLGSRLAQRMARAVDELGWSISEFDRVEMRPVLNALYSLPLNYGVKATEVRRDEAEIVTVALEGPFHWSRNAKIDWLFDSPSARQTGVYLWTVPNRGREWAYYVGETGRSFGQRLSEHISAYLSGRYSILDAESLARGDQRLAWSTGDSSYGASLTDFVGRLEDLAPKIRLLLERFHFYVAPVQGDKRMRLRIEAALGRHFQNSPDDRIRNRFGAGARFAASIPFESPLLGRFSGGSKIVGMPEELLF